VFVSLVYHEPRMLTIEERIKLITNSITEHRRQINKKEIEIKSLQRRLRLLTAKNNEMRFKFLKYLE